MNFRSIMSASALALTAVSVSAPVLAHTKIVASIPAQGATVSSVRNVTMTFSEALLVPTVGVSIVMTAMPGMPNHGEMQIRNFTQSWSDSNRKLTLKLKKPLVVGTYEVRWQAAGADGHRMKGKVNFVVK